MSDNHKHFACPNCATINRVPAERTADGPKCGKCGSSLAADGAPVQVSDAELRKLIRSSPVPVLVDFWAAWCAPCRMLGPVLHELGEQNSGELIVAKVDTEQYQEMARQLGVRGIPALFLFKGGNLVAQETGARPLPFWQSWVEPHLAA